ncbi:MAG: NAD(P)H-binding protein [Actinomycetota bacterium]
MHLLVTGATGFVGGALVPRLLAAGHEVTCLVREPARLGAAWRDDVRVVQGRVEDGQAVLRAADGADAGYYLVHGMASSTRDLVDRERRAAAAFRDGADLAGLQRVIYLGGLVDEDRLHTTSPHLYARQQAGVELTLGPVPVTQLRAGIVLGAGSASFALLLAAARLPVQLEAPWSASLTQPIALHDLLELLTVVLAEPLAAGQVLDVGGPDVVSYAELVRRTRTIVGARELLRLRVPYLPPEAVALTAAAAAGIEPALALGLLPSARHDAIVRDADACRHLLGWSAGTDLDTALQAAYDAQREQPTSG